MDKVTLAERSEVLRVALRDIRLEKGLSQGRVAELIQEPQSFVSKYESGVRRLDVVELEEVTAALGVTVEEVLTRYKAMGA